MKRLIKNSCYLLATILVIIISQTAAFAADVNTENGGLSSAQVAGGLSILLLAILIPTIKKERKSAN